MDVAAVSEKGLLKLPCNGSHKLFFKVVEKCTSEEPTAVYITHTLTVTQTKQYMKKRKVKGTLKSSKGCRRAPVLIIVAAAMKAIKKQHAEGQHGFCAKSFDGEQNCEEIQKLISTLRISKAGIDKFFRIRYPDHSDNLQHAATYPSVRGRHAASRPFKSPMQSADLPRCRAILTGAVQGGLSKLLRPRAAESGAQPVALHDSCTSLLLQQQAPSFLPSACAKLRAHVPVCVQRCVQKCLLDKTIKRHNRVTTHCSDYHIKSPVAVNQQDFTEFLQGYITIEQLKYPTNNFLCYIYDSKHQ
ncbi:hypothetical protein Anapl_12153 [Anas platyrhynchos]|uniref:Uncharacterized protein n=1 Tax=Anas platyrhynchos TaxID=8839 RepID=R0JXF8_ANAPL|nr:hypothetical protein Anapl_12153 [Anas platyrhynchos]